VAIDAGRLLRTAPLTDFTERTGQLLVETDEDAAALADRLVRRGMDASASGRTLVVDVASGGERQHAVEDAVRDEVIDLGLALVRVEHRRHQLEDLFRDDAGGTDDRVA
jgi:ABC-2 type transport system ATP-binding protein